MPLPPEVEAIDGAQQLYDWFGYWPGFHDAEIIKFQLEASASSVLIVHTWEMTNKVSTSGFYETSKHAVVEFRFEGVTKLGLQDLWEHSILFELIIKKIECGFCLDISSSYGLSGTIEAKSLSLRIIPGKPS